MVENFIVIQLIFAEICVPQYFYIRADHGFMEPANTCVAHKSHVRKDYKRTEVLYFPNPWIEPNHKPFPYCCQECHLLAEHVTDSDREVRNTFHISLINMWYVWLSGKKGSPPIHVMSIVGAPRDLQEI